MKVVVKKVNQNPTVENIRDDIAGGLQDLQRIVDGYIQAIEYNGVLLICNEEGKLKGLSPNLFAGRDMIVGNVVFVGKNGDEFVSLSDAQTNMLLNKFTSKRG